MRVPQKSACSSLLLALALTGCASSPEAPGPIPITKDLTYVAVRVTGTSSVPTSVLSPPAAFDEPFLVKNGGVVALVTTVRKKSSSAMKIAEALSFEVEGTQYHYLAGERLPTPMEMTANGRVQPLVRVTLSSARDVYIPVSSTGELGRQYFFGNPSALGGRLLLGGGVENPKGRLSSIEDFNAETLDSQEFVFAGKTTTNSGGDQAKIKVYTVSGDGKRSFLRQDLVGGRRRMTCGPFCQIKYQETPAGDVFLIQGSQ